MRGARRRRGGTREGGGGDAEPQERPDTTKPGAPRGPGTHLHHPTGATTWSASRNHPGEDTGTRNSPPLSEDPADTTDDEKHRPDGPTEPPDERKGTRGQRGELRVQSENWKVDDDDGEGVEARCKPVATQEPEAPSLEEVDEVGVADKSADTKVSRGVTEEAPQEAQDEWDVENSSRMGFIVSSLHKLDLISVVEYCSFSLVTTL